jgi:hypothetical protein
VRGDAPFSILPASVHDVFLLGEQMLLVFEPGGRETSTDLTKPWGIIGSWHELIVEIGIGERAVLERSQGGSGSPDPVPQAPERFPVVADGRRLAVKVSRSPRRMAAQSTRHAVGNLRS